MLLRRRLLSVVLVLVSAGAGVVACSTAESRAPSPNWRPCAENAAVECATVAVPVDWADPAGASIDMAVARKRASGPGRIGTLVFLPGGPGTSGVDELLRHDRFSPALHEKFDIVSVDPRGVKRSHPLRCDSGLAAARPNLVPDTGAQFSEVASYATDLAASCREYTGPLADHLDSASVARDVEELRKMLGENTLSFYGPSYGTMPGQSYLEQFPRRVRAMVLDGVDDHSLDGPEFLATEARAAQDTFAEFVSWCDRETACVLHGRNVPALFDRLYERAVRGELSSPAGTPLSPLDLGRTALQPLYEPDWPKEAELLRSMDDQPPGPAPAPVPRRRGEPVAAPELIACSDWSFDIPDQSRWESLWREQNRNAGTLRAHFAWVAGSICSFWPPAPNPPHRPRITSAPPILITTSKHDPATPHEWATHVTANTPNATLLTYEGWGHGVYSRTPCTTHATDNYLLDPTAHPTLSCPASP